MGRREPYKLVIEKPYPSLNSNELRGRGYRWTKKRWNDQVSIVIKSAGIPTHLNRIHLVIRYFFSRRDKRRSPENYSPKLLLDAFILTQIVTDDGPTYLTYIMPFSDPTTFGFIDKDNPRVEIDVYPWVGTAVTYGYITNDKGEAIAYGYSLSM